MYFSLEPERSTYTDNKDQHALFSCYSFVFLGSGCRN
jgi:hypothetical protein